MKAMSLLQRILSTPAGRMRLILGGLIVAELALITCGPSASAAKKAIAEAAAAGTSAPWEADADLGIRYAAVINLGLLILFASTAPIWLRPATAIQLRTPNSELRTPPWFWPAVLAAIVLCMALRLPLAGKSLWWDECWVIRQCSHGSWKPDKADPGELKFSPTTWKRCAFYYQKPTNHVPMSLAQKASLSLWRMFSGGEKHEFSDLAARAPALLASAASIILIACLLRRWGRPGVGVVAAGLLALHPWHIRYGVDARAYALVAPLCVSALFAAACLVESRGRKARHWVWLGLNQFLWLWAYPNGLIDVAAMFAVLAWLLVRQEEGKADKWAVFARLAATHVFAAMLLLQVFLPNFMQARHWAGQEADKHLIDGPMLLDTASQIMTGTPWQRFDSPAAPALGESAMTAPVLSGNPASLLLVFPLLIVAAIGLRGFRFEPHRHHWLLWGLLASSVVFMLVTRIAHSYFYPRFVIALLPVAVIGLAMNCRLSAWRTSIATQLATVLPLLLAFLAATWEAKEVLLRNPISPLRDVAALLHELPASIVGGRPRVLCYGLGREALQTYYPDCIGVTKPEEILEHLRTSQADHHKLHLVLGYEAFNRARLPDGFKLIDNPAMFREIARFNGIEPDFSFRILAAEPIGMGQFLPKP